MDSLHRGQASVHRWNYIQLFAGGAFLANSIPHIGNGISGRPFQSPFAKPPGEGLSSSTVNVIWGFFNLVVGWLLVFRTVNFDLHDTCEVLPVLAGAMLLSVGMARRFGRFHGGNSPAGKPE